MAVTVWLKGRHPAEYFMQSYFGFSLPHRPLLPPKRACGLFHISYLLFIYVRKKISLVRLDFYRVVFTNK